MPAKKQAAPRETVIYAPPRGPSLTTVLVIGLIAFIAYDRWNHHRGDDGAAPDRGRVDRRLAADLSAAIDGNKVAAVYFAKICKGVAARLEIDGKSSTPMITRRQEAFELAGNVGQFATDGIDGMSFRDLPDVLTEHFADAGFDNETKDGELTAKDRDTLVDAWNELAAAFGSL